MARMPRLVIPGLPHHVTQRGNRGMQTFFGAEDYEAYLALVVQHKAESGIELWAYCLMPNHVHLVLVPSKKDSLARFFRQVHVRYTRAVNRRYEWQGHLWQERFHSFVMDERHLYSAVRYTELNPVRARLCEQPEHWQWSSVHAHIAGKSNQLVTVEPMLQRVGDWQHYLAQGLTDAELAQIRQHGRTGRPAGDETFINALAALTGRTIQKQRPGPKPGIK